MTHSKLHPLEFHSKPPRQFTFPFHYQPHPLCVQAAAELSAYVQSRSEWAEELSRGKMLGVLVVHDSDGREGFLAAFSGNLCGSNQHDYFVPPVYDLLQPDGIFRRGEKEISKINDQIARLEGSEQLHLLREALCSARDESEIERYRELVATAKAQRQQLRLSGNLTDQELAKLDAQSQFQKAELRRLRLRHEHEVQRAEAAVKGFTLKIDELKLQRKRMSEDLQRRIFGLFVVQNARGETSDLTHIFANATGTLPPAGAGECCAPKLLNYAFTHGMQPLCMAEFWWGQSPVREIRRHGSYYPSCQSKCKPILEFMLRGLDVELNPLVSVGGLTQLKVEYDDEWIMVVNKPAGMLSVPGKGDGQSVLSIVAKWMPHASGPLVVHRLDQATSGLLVIAKTKDVHKALQEQFATRKVSKTYEAVLSGDVEANDGYVRLPLRADIDDRPRQIVDFDNGKVAVTAYRVLARNADGTTRVELHPLTGRTHQLRVHAAHPQGLNAPIVGDRLYGGNSHERLLLHARSITFVHPVTGHRVTVSSQVPF